MDDMVRQAMAKWPDVPNCYGWLALDRRGQWRVRNEYAQQHGLSGDPIRHDAMVAFIERNYLRDANGAWFFQNGPQRVYVELEAAPWVWRLHGDSAAPRIESHTGAPARFESAWVDEDERFFLATDMGLGLVHTLDMETAADAIEAGTWTPERAMHAELLRRFGVQLHPAGM